MHLSLWGHAMKSGVNWGYEGISEHCWWCIIPEPSHIKGKSPLGFTVSLHLPWPVSSCLTCWHVWSWNWATALWFWGPDIKNWCLKIDENYHRNQSVSPHNKKIPGAFQISFLFFLSGGFFLQISVLFYSVTAKSDGLTGPKLNPEKNLGFLSPLSTSRLNVQRL